MSAAIALEFAMVLYEQGMWSVEGVWLGALALSATAASVGFVGAVVMYEMHRWWSVK